MTILKNLGEFMRLLAILYIFFTVLDFIGGSSSIPLLFAGAVAIVVFALILR